VRPSAFAVLRLMTRLELDRLRDGQVGRLGPFENPSSIDAGLSVRIGEAGAVTRETAGHRMTNFGGLVSLLTGRLLAKTYASRGTEMPISRRRQRRSLEALADS